jgi:hypothetical protein
MAYNRLKNRPEPNLNDDFHKFICDCVGLPPSSYGPKIESKIKLMFDLISNKPSLECGDLRKNRTNFELKTSYLSKSNTYTVANIRQWHNFDYYILCFIDSTQNFNYKFFVLNKEDIKNFKLYGQNGTIESNKENVHVGLRCQISQNGDDMKLLSSLNILPDNSLESLSEFIDQFKMKKNTSKKYQLSCRFNSVVSQSSDEISVNVCNFKLSHNVFTNNYFSFLRNYENTFGKKPFYDTVIEKSLRSFVKTDEKLFKNFVKDSNSYFKLGKHYVSTYSSTERKLAHLNHIVKNHNSLIQKSNVLVDDEDFYTDIELNVIEVN